LTIPPGAQSGCVLPARERACHPCAATDEATSMCGNGRKPQASEREATRSSANYAQNLLPAPRRAPTRESFLEKAKKFLSIV
jgi:hypothetical protein